MPSIVTRARSALARLIAPGAAQKRAFAAASTGRLTADWVAAATSADAEIRFAYRRLIDRSRSLERDNDYQRGFLLSCHRNINGAHRYDLRSDAGEYVTKKTAGQTSRVWQPDMSAKSVIEDAWREWGRKGVCTVDRRTTWRGVRRLAVRAVVRDGNFIARKIIGPAAGNRFGFALQLWEIDHLDLEKNEAATRTGNEIRFGIEFDSFNAPVAYWLKARHPGDYYGATSSGFASTRFPASEIYHLFLGDRAEQTIGYPWIVSAITRLRQLGAFEEAATIAARLGASNAVFFETSGEGEYTGATDSDGREVMDIEPGTSIRLPQGWKANPNNPHYPNIETGDFRKAMLRGVCSSLGVSYTTLGNDLESVNFSSARVGLFDEREGWKDLQLFFSEELWELIFSDWLQTAIGSGAISLPLAKLAKFDRPIFKARRWPAIDPLKEVEAARAEIALRLSSRREKVEERGGDIEEVYHDNRDDELLAEELGLSLISPDLDPQSVVTDTTVHTPDAKPKGAPAEPDDDKEDDAPPPAKKKPRPSA